MDLTKNPYYNPQGLYGVKKSFATSPAIGGPTGYLEQNPQAAYARHIAGYAGGLDNWSKFVQGQYDRLRQGYEAAAATNPNLTFQQFMGGFGQNFFQNLYSGLTQSQRGERPEMFAGRARWQTNG